MTGASLPVAEVWVNRDRTAKVYPLVAPLIFDCYNQKSKRDSHFEEGHSYWERIRAEVCMANDHLD